MLLQGSSDALLAAEATEILRKMQLLEANIVFGAERRCKAMCAAVRTPGTANQEGARV